MRIFICAGEPSGDIHGSNLVRTLKKLHPGVECVGFGGDRMEAAGCHLLYPLCQLAIMGFSRVLANVTTFLGLLSRADRYFRHQRPDAVVLIDYPGFNWWLARRAHFHGIPVFYFVPPQLWGWAGWRVKKMQRWVDHVLCTLPFEKSWYQERGVEAHYVGHPFFDELPRQVLDEKFVRDEQQKGTPIIGLLPGSRTQEVHHNLSTLVRAAARIRQTRPDVRFMVACFRAQHQAMVDEYLKKHQGLPIQTFVGRTPEIIHLAKACVSVSGSVTLELLYQKKPTVIVYRVGKFNLRLARFFIKSRFISLVNLLAQKELFPEFLTDRCEAEKVAGHVLRWLNDEEAFTQIRAELTDLRHQVAEPGACEQTARFILEKLMGQRGLRVA
jgi:lipid-A-disaccharide synthase